MNDFIKGVLRENEADLESDKINTIDFRYFA